MIKCMRYMLVGVFFVFALFNTAQISTVSAESTDATAKDLPPEYDFPNSFTFVAEITAPNPIASIELQYVAEKDTCITFFATAYPSYEKKPFTKVTWKWDFKQTGNLPIGTTIQWNWKVVDNTGHITYTPVVHIDWMNYSYEWQKTENEDLTVYWVNGDKKFGNEVLEIAQKALNKNIAIFGLKPHKHYKVFVYPDNQTFQNDQLYIASWTGGLSYPDAGIVAIGIDINNKKEFEWGKSAIVHELTHAVFAQKEFTCLGTFPTWIQEGTAQYIEFSVYPISDTDNQTYLDYIAQNGVYSIRTMNEGFGVDSAKVHNLYTQSYYLVRYLVETYGKDKYLEMYKDIHDGKGAEDAIRKNYDFSFEQLEVKFAAFMKSRSTSSMIEPTQKLVPTIVPTIVPIAPQNSQLIGGWISRILVFAVIGMVIFVVIVLSIVLLIKNNRRVKSVVSVVPNKSTITDQIETLEDM